MFSKLLSFLFSIYLIICELFSLPLNGYDSKELFRDTLFANGFNVASQSTENANQEFLGEFTYGSEANPDWSIAQWNSGKCIWADRIESDSFTLTDGSSKMVRYNPEDYSVSLRLNAAAVYNGAPAGSDAWPHLLLEQSPLTDYSALSESDKKFYNCSADRIILSLDIRISDYIETLNQEGINAVQFLSYIYLKTTDNRNFVWFGLDLFDNRGYNDVYWSPDIISGNMIYSLSTADVYGFKSRSLFRNGKPYLSDDWVHVQVDLTDHISDFIKRCNEDNVFGCTVTKEDFYIDGTNIGFEIHGNYDCTVDIKDYSLVSYIKK